MTRVAMAEKNLFAQILDPANRHNPYPLYAQLRETPVSAQAGTYVISTHAEITALLHDPRISSDESKSICGAGALAASGGLTLPDEPSDPAFIFRDPPDHDRLRRLVMQQFTPGRIGCLHEDVARLAGGMLDARRGQGQLDVVDDLAYPLAVAVICELLGVPPGDEPRFRRWAGPLAHSLDPAEAMTEQEIQRAAQALMEMREYLGDLAVARRARPDSGLISGLISAHDDTGQMNQQELLSTMSLLLIAGHQTSVNLIANGMLTLLRHPDALERLRREPELIPTLVEEVLRFDPPVQFRTRTTLAGVEVAGVAIPTGATVVLLLASGSRDSACFPRADEFIPDRVGTTHLGFGGGIHYCVAAPLARMEAQIALTELARRLAAPRLLADPPPYRASAALRGPAHLPVAFDHLTN
jgi:hypothetical protein